MPGVDAHTPLAVGVSPGYTLTVTNTGSVVVYYQKQTPDGYTISVSTHDGQINPGGAQTFSVSVWLLGAGPGTQVDCLITENSSGGGGAVSSVNGKTGVVILAASDVGADASGAAGAVQGSSLQKSSNLSDLNSASTARANLGLGTAATSNTSAFDASGAASTAQTAAQSFATSAVATETTNRTAADALLAAKASPTFTGVATSPVFAASGLTGATAATRYVGGTTSGAPASGTFAKGDFVIDQTGAVWICTTAGTPGTWTAPSNGATAPTTRAYTTAADTLLLADNNNVVRSGGSPPAVQTIPQHSSVAFPYGTGSGFSTNAEIELFCAGANGLLVQGAGSATTRQEGDAGNLLVNSGTAFTPFGSAVLSGSTVICFVRASSGQSTSGASGVTSITGTGMTLAFLGSAWLSGIGIEVWGADNVAGGGTSLTVTTSGALQYLAYAREVTGHSLVTSYIGGATGTSTTAALSAAPTSMGSQVLIVGNMQTPSSPPTVSPTAPWADYTAGGWAFSVFAFVLATQTTGAAETAEWLMPSQMWGLAGVLITPSPLVTVLTEQNNGLCHIPQNGTASIRQDAQDSWVLTGNLI